ncbi:hypothetical protein MMC34_003206 [Xylographa carneopallida]|nr:hypothetical protein [Xylographa carneopallida]
MAAVRSPLMPSPNSNLMSAFSPYSDSPTSPAPYNKRSSTDSTGHLQPQPQYSPLVSSPSHSNVADNSPIAPSSTGTDTTDIDDTTIEEEDAHVEATPPTKQNMDAFHAEGSLKLKTKDAAGNDFMPSSAEDEPPSSVIHAPKGFELFHARTSPTIRRSTPTPSQRSDITIISASPNEEYSGKQKAQNNSPLSPPPISTAIAPLRDWSATPRAQTRQEAEIMEQETRARLNSRSLEDIPETQDVESSENDTYRDSLMDTTIVQFQESADEVAALKLALSECWTLCNTLAGLSYIHRDRVFRYIGKNDGREQAWKSCWKLCQKLYDTRDEDFAIQVRPTLDLCREFCQSLFEVRQRENDVADSVLRVSFELNNHLFNTHDRNLPEAFRERTLDFYITLCHRLMKQRTHMGEETDALLRACWSLAEMLFSLRQNKRDGKPADEELLGSAVQACWELCDLFREGWTQIRPDRGTPRASQTTFTQAFQQAKQTEKAVSISEVGESDIEDDEFGRLNPETPTTVFEDTQQMSPDEAQVPNILVLGPDTSDRFPGPQWSSSSSTLSGYSQSSENTTSSTSTIMNPSEDPRLTCLKLLIVKAAMNIGFKRGEKLSLFVKNVPSNSFGTATWQMHLLESYKKLVATDPAFRSAGPSRRVSAAEVGRAVQWMVRSGQYSWLKDLFRVVLGFHAEEAEMRKNVMLQS